ncbi:MAG: histidine kinase [Candidatus Eisenbacteria bacterium]
MNTPRPQRSFGRCVLDAVWQTPLWAVPFAVFFGTLYGAQREVYVLSYEISLVFALTIRLALLALGHFAMPALRRATPGGRAPSLPIHITLYAAVSVAGSYLAAFIIHETFLPGFLGTPRAVAVTGMYALVFSFLIGGIAYAIHFYRQSLEHARAVEGMRAELAQAELRALRAQIEPHFLFNTLNAIAALMPTDPAAAEEMTTRLAEVFRYALSASERETAPLAEEIAFATAYLDIERARFGERLRVVVTVEPGLEGAAVPSLLLQPVVENAVRHGIAQRAHGGTIRTTAARAGSRLRLAVEDDGPGMSPEASARARGDAAADPRVPGGRGFGLHALRERLRATGSDDALAIETPAGGGTRIVLTLPLTPP